VDVVSTATADRLATDLADAWGGVRRRLRRGARRVVEGDPLTPAAVELLRLVDARPSIGVREAADALHLAPNTVSTLVSALADRGLLQRRADPADRRAARLEVTAGARRRMRTWRDERDRLLAGALERLPVEDRRALEASVGPLRRLLAALEEDVA
jgi:DNA-binding MarR family transcriptional regulator